MSDRPLSKQESLAREVETALSPPVGSHFILDDDNEPVPVSIQEYAIWATRENRLRLVGRTDFHDENGEEVSSVSTVFLGLDHRFSGDGDTPVLWETMIFGGDNDEYQQRYTSHDDAVVGHQKAVAIVKAEYPDATEYEP